MPARPCSHLDDFFGRGLALRKCVRTGRDGQQECGRQQKRIVRHDYPPSSRAHWQTISALFWSAAKPQYGAAAPRYRAKLPEICTSRTSRSTWLPFDPSGSRIRLVSAESPPGGAVRRLVSRFRSSYHCAATDRLRGPTVILLRAAPELHVQTARGSAPFVRSRRNRPNRNRRAGQLGRTHGCCRDGRKAQGP